MEKKKSKIRNAAFLLVACTVAAWLGSFSGAANRTYELRPDVPLSYQNTSNTVMVLDAYERLMDNYMSLVQSNLNAVSGDVSQSARTLVNVDRKLDNLAVRIARIERALDIQTVSPGSGPAGDLY